MISTAVHAFSEGAAAGLALAKQLDCAFGQVETRIFPDEEVLPTVPGAAETVIVYRSLDRPNAKLVELILAAEAWRRLGARRLVLVAPYLAYMRQDAAFLEGQPISQHAVARLLAQHFDRVVTVNAHLHRTHALTDLFPSIPAQNLSVGAALGAWLHTQGVGGAVVVGPDEEATPLACSVAQAFGSRCLVMTKARLGDRTVKLSAAPVDRFQGRRVVIVDDICSTGSTLAAAIERVLGMGAARVDAFVVHALFDAQAEARLRAAGASAIWSTDSVPHASNALPLGPLLAAALQAEMVR